MTVKLLFITIFQSCILFAQVKAMPVQHVRHESIEEVENLPVSNKRKPSPSRDPPGPSNPVEHGPELKRQKTTNVWKMTLIFCYPLLSGKSNQWLLLLAG